MTTIVRFEEDQGYHRLYAVWYFSFNLKQRELGPRDTTGFMPCGTSASTFPNQALLLGSFRLKRSLHAA